MGMFKGPASCRQEDEEETPVTYLCDIADTLDRVEEELRSLNSRLSLKMGESLNFAEIFNRLEKLEGEDNGNS